MCACVCVFALRATDVAAGPLPSFALSLVAAAAAAVVVVVVVAAVVVVVVGVFVVSLVC